MKQGLLVALLLLPLFAAGQTQAGSGHGSPPGYQRWSNPDLHLTYLYPTDLTARDGGFALLAGRRMVYGENAEGDEGKADTCVKVLLSLGKGHAGSQGSWVQVGVVEIRGECLPPKILRDKKTSKLLLRNLVIQGTTVMGTMPLEVPALYELEGHRASFCATQGSRFRPETCKRQISS